MILQRIEITLVGPDEYPADEGSDAVWAEDEEKAKAIFVREAKWFLASVGERLTVLGDYEIEVSPDLNESGAVDPSAAPDGYGL